MRLAPLFAQDPDPMTMVRGFVEFFLYSAPYVALATAATLWLAARQFGIQRIKAPDQRLTAAALVDSFDENDSIESRGFFWFGAIMTTLFILTIATTSVLPWVSPPKP